MIAIDETSEVQAENGKIIYYSASQIRSLLAECEGMASWSNGEYQTDLHYHGVRLLRHTSGRLYLGLEGGAAMSSGRLLRLTRDDAKTFLVSTATHPITGYTYAPDDAERMLDGESVDGAEGSRREGVEPPHQTYYFDRGY